MLLIIRKVVFLVGLTLYIISAHSQTVTSMRNGVWNDPTIWSTGLVPTSLNASSIVIDHEVELSPSFVVSALQLIVNGKLTIKGASQLTITPDGSPSTPDLSVAGTLICEEGGVLNGTSASNTFFMAGSEYIHQQGPLGFIPYATWDMASTFIINGFKDSGYINIAHSDSWKQNFGNVIYDCPQQSIFVVDLNGYLRNVAGDFTIKNTNNKTLRLSTTQNPLINIGGSFTVQGPSEIWFSTNGTSTVVNIQKDFKYFSTSAGPSYLTTRGAISFNISGNLEWNSPGPMRMASSSSDSLGMRRAVVNLDGDLLIGAGVVIAPPSGSGNGKFVFRGTDVQTVNASPLGLSFQGNLDYTVAPGAVVDLGNSALSNTTGSLQVFGTLRVGSSDVQGAIQLGKKGNIHISGSRQYEAGSTIEYNGNAPQWIGDGQPSSGTVNLTISNPTTTSLLQNVTCSDFKLSAGALLGPSNTVSVYGEVMAYSPAMLDIAGLRLEGNRDQSISAANLVINDLSINKSAGSITISNPLSLKGLLLIESANTIIHSNGYLTLLSTSDGGSGTARVGPLPNGSQISGDVTVQRYMSAEGKIFRYISSPVTDASVEDLKDDFAITGKFADPTTGPGIKSGTPSLYYYDESAGTLQGGWKPYPATGLAKDNLLEKGRGYCALVRPGGSPIVWDVTGILNQGDIELPVAMTGNMAPSNGWNLVGNPYACTIDWDLDGPAGWTKEDISPVFCIRDNGIGSWGGVRYWDGDINYDDIPNGHIATGQSIWVKAIGPNPRLIVREGAKVTNDATFYREAQTIPSFVLTLKKDDYKDKAYYKVRGGASAGLDIWDAPKMENDHFDISTLSSEGHSLAINSQDSLPCGQKVIPVRTKDLKRGTYKLELDTRFDFSTYDYTWVDRFSRTETPLRPGEEIDVEIPDDGGSKTFDRFALRLREIIPEDSVTVVCPSFVCSGKSLKLTIINAQRGILYSVWERGRKISEEVTSFNSNLDIEIAGDSIPAGLHRLEIFARSACHFAMLSTNPIVQKHEAELIAPGVKACQGDSVRLSVTSISEVRHYSWFASETSADTLAKRSSWTTPPLMKSETFYVSGTLRNGCTTKRQPVTVNITNFEPASITISDSYTLCSNYLTSSRWILNGQLISNAAEIRPEISGTYVLLIDTLGCAGTDTVDFYHVTEGSNDPAEIGIYPNPTRDFVNVIPFNQSADIDIIANVGGEIINLKAPEIWSGEGITIDVRNFSAGTYFAIVRTSNRKRIIRFVKTE